MFITRRYLSKSLGLVLVSGLTACSGLSLAEKKSKAAITKKFAELEKKLVARLGAAVLDTHTGQRWTHREHERFPMCSTFKLLASSAVLAKVDAGKEQLNRKINIEAKDLVSFSPITEKRVGPEGMSLAELCEAAITRSDNTAANMILKILGGPAAVTQFSRTLGDSVTRLDRFETELNEATPGDLRDTTSPSAMVENIRTLLLTNKLSKNSRNQLKAWLISNKTGDARLRAGLSNDWITGDKTGTGAHGTVNDVAIIWPPNRRPMIVSIYITETAASLDDCNKAIAEIARSLMSITNT
jgi:beta-lactamase class A